jgi:hypothetical protein
MGKLKYFKLPQTGLLQWVRQHPPTLAKPTQFFQNLSLSSVLSLAGGDVHTHASKPVSALLGKGQDFPPNNFLTPEACEPQAP